MTVLDVTGLVGDDAAAAPQLLAGAPTAVDLTSATLGTGEDEQYVDALTGMYKEKFLLHYNFPPYSVGEVGRFGAPGRREVGHGKLAWRAIRPMLPSSEDFPYTIRLVSEITESTGSSSLATVCGSSLAMMDAGVPLIRPVSTSRCSRRAPPCPRCRLRASLLPVSP